MIFRDETFRSHTDMAGFVSVEVHRADIRLKLGQRHRGDILRYSDEREEGRGRAIDLAVGRLGGEDDGDEELKRCLIIKLRLGRGLARLYRGEDRITGTIGDSGHSFF